MHMYEPNYPPNVSFFLLGISKGKKEYTESVMLSHPNTPFRSECNSMQSCCIAFGQVVRSAEVHIDKVYLPL